MTQRGQGKRKRALDEQILAKAHQHIKPSTEDRDDDDGDEDDDDNEPLPQISDAEMVRMLNPEEGGPPKKKLRKPRHTEKKPKPEPKGDDDDDKNKEIPTKKKKRKKKSKTKKNPPPIKTPESTRHHTTEGLQFLQSWKNSRAEWKFEKRKQIWLLQNCLNPDMVPDSDFPILLEYMSSVKGQARESTEKEMSVVMKSCEILQNPSDASSLRYERARQIVQMLSSE